MFSLPSLRKSSALIKQVVANQRSNSVRPVFNQSKDSASSSSPFLSLLQKLSSAGGSTAAGDKNSGGDQLLRSVSTGVLIVGSTLGFCYFSRSSFDSNSWVSFADAPKGATWATDSVADQFKHGIPDKKSKYLFGGSLVELMKHRF